MHPLAEKELTSQSWLSVMGQFQHFVSVRLHEEGYLCLVMWGPRPSRQHMRSLYGNIDFEKSVADPGRCQHCTVGARATRLFSCLTDKQHFKASRHVKA